MLLDHQLSRMGTLWVGGLTDWVQVFWVCSTCLAVLFFSWLPQNSGPPNPKHLLWPSPTLEWMVHDLREPIHECVTVLWMTITGHQRRVGTFDRFTPLEFGAFLGVDVLLALVWGGCWRRCASHSGFWAVVGGDVLLALVWGCSRR